ncbi:hypothetical protein HW555_006152 [Spodoptera exigua]|uniref:Xanthine dehydrogenase n=1 Tax=Spodoptera exigua TaxID=7107 RepID=A0A835GH25_SPOEX|nr:hypothetical protein HW555_006152 [Spodoptera exigua]
MDTIWFKVNGVRYTVKSGEVNSDLTLLDYLRNHLELRGTKYMCREAGCGSCMVTVKQSKGQPYAVNSCMLTVVSCHGLNITTIEGLGNRHTGYHPLQTTLAKYNGSQCGYCSPGWIMSMHSLQESNPNLTQLEIEQSLGSNICRCTGYRPIFDAFKSLAVDSVDKNLQDIEDLKICEKTGNKCDEQHCDDSDWCIVKEDDLLNTRMIQMKLKDGKYWYKVTCIKNIFDILDDKGEDSYMLVAGNTARGAYPIEEFPRVMIDINAVPELKGYKIDQNLIIYGGVTLTELLDIFKRIAAQEYFAYLTKFYDHLRKVAHIPVRNIGTIAGNLMIKHKHNFFASDIYLLLQTVGAQLTLVRRHSRTKTVTMEEFLKIDMKGVIILNVMLPPLSCEYQVATFKVMPRSTSYHSIVNAGFLYQLHNQNKVICSRIAFGGLSPSFTRASKTERFLTGKQLFTNDTLQSAVKVLNEEIVVEENPPEPSVEYRRKLALGLFYKGLLSLCPDNLLNARYKTGAIKIHDTRPVSKGVQYFETDPSTYPLNQPIQKVEALIQCAGEAHYTDDLPSLPNEVHAAFVVTTIGVGEIVSIDASKALSQPGVVAFYTAKDIPGHNSFTPTNGRNFPVDEEIFCEKQVKYFNQPLGVIVAETHALAEKAAKMVKVQYKNIRKPVLDVKEAIKDPNRVSFYASDDATDVGKDVQKVIKGGVTIYAQNHFCIENIPCVIRPTEEGIKVYTSSQYVDSIHVGMSKALNVDQSSIDIYVRRVGGSYGLKLTRNVQAAIACALVVLKLNRTCRFIQSLTSTTRSLGKKLPSTTNYEIAVNNSGVIQYINYNLYMDNGHTVNFKFNFLIMSSYNNCYDKSRWNLRCYNATTDVPKNDWLRAIGALDGIAHAELIMERISYELALDPIQVRLNNLDRQTSGAIEDMYDTLKSQAKYDDRRLVVDNYNKQNRWKKRGLRFSFTRWPLPALGYNNVLLSIYHGDGSVAIAHGGIEMGQGINTKVIQVCAYYFKIPLSKIKVKGYDTMSTPNSAETAGSIGSQNIALGVSRCCETILERLKPIRNKMGDATWEQIVEAAHTAGIDLQAQSFVNTSDATKYSYNVFGVALAEVEIDVLTGESELIRVDVMENVGKSISPEIDVGQVEGGFMMGVGYWTSERLVYDKNTGELLTNRTWNYAVPMNTDIPQDFRVYFKKNSYSYAAIHGAKAVGEPPMCMSVVVALAIREAISEARKESGIPTTQWFNIDGPSTVEVIGLSTETKVSDFKFN